MIPVNGMGAVFVLNFMWFLIFLCEMALLFMPIFAFLYILKMVIGRI